jgi:hypothetical protein
VNISDEQLATESLRMFYLLQPQAFAAEDDAMQKYMEESKKARIEVEAGEEKARKLVENIKKYSDRRVRICAALAKGEGAVDQIISAVITVLGVSLLAGKAVDVGVSPQAIVVAIVLLIIKMGSGYFCA